MWASGLPWAVAVRPAPGAAAILLAVIGSVWLLMPRGFPLRVVGAVLWLPLLLPPADELAAGTFWAEVIDVGQGTAILIRTADHALLYDTGAAFADSDAGERIIVPYLRAAGVDALSGLIVSHDDNDHSGGLRPVLRDIPTGWLLHGMPAGSRLLQDAIAPRHCARGQRWQWNGVDFSVLNSPAGAHLKGNRRDNDFSCVLKVSVGEHSLLVTGDAERRGELELLESGADVAATVLVAGHHGSRSSSMAEFLERVRPRHVVFTMVYRNRFGHPHSQVVARFRDLGANILRSDRGGLIRFEFAEAGVVAAEYRPSLRHYWHADSSP